MTIEASKGNKRTPWEELKYAWKIYNDQIKESASDDDVNSKDKMNVAFEQFQILYIALIGEDHKKRERFENDIAGIS